MPPLLKPENTRKNLNYSFLLLYSTFQVALFLLEGLGEFVSLVIHWHGLNFISHFCDINKSGTKQSGQLKV